MFLYSRTHISFVTCAHMLTESLNIRAHNLSFANISCGPSNRRHYYPIGTIYYFMQDFKLKLNEYMKTSSLFKRQTFPPWNSFLENFFCWKFVLVVLEILLNLYVSYDINVLKNIFRSNDFILYPSRAKIDPADYRAKSR